MEDNMEQSILKLSLILKVEAEPGEFALYLMHETGERRIISETEFPLLVRVR